MTQMLELLYVKSVYKPELEALVIISSSVVAKSTSVFLLGGEPWHMEYSAGLHKYSVCFHTTFPPGAKDSELGASQGCFFSN